LAKVTEEPDPGPRLAGHGLAFCHDWHTVPVSSNARKITWLAQGPQKKPAAPIQNGPARQEIGDLSLQACRNSIVKVHFGTDYQFQLLSFI
jgi:hypothetical protein